MTVGDDNATTPGDDASPGSSPQGSLHAPSGVLLGPIERPRRLTPFRVAVQVIGIIVGLGLLGWTLSLAFTGDNAQGLRTALDAPLWIVLSLFALGLSIVILNGFIFWIGLLPVRRLSLLELVAVNALATLLALLPFKLSVFVRAMVHRRRHHLGYALILAWFASIGLIGAAVFAPAAGFALLIGEASPAWFAWSGVGIVLSAGACVVLGRILLARPRLDRLALGAGAMLAHTGSVIVQVVLRLVELGMLTARFVLAAMAAGFVLEVDAALILATTWFIVNTASPAGALGAREGAIVGVGTVLSGLGVEPSQVAVIALVTSGSEIAVLIPAGLIAAVRLRLDRVLRPHAGDVSSRRSDEASSSASA